MMLMSARRPGSDAAAVCEAHLLGRAGCLQADGVFQPEFGAACPVARPVAEQVGGEAAVADIADMGPAIGEAEDCVRAFHHAADGFIIAFHIVHHRHEDLPATTFREEVIVEDLLARSSAGFGEAEQGLGDGLFIVRNGAQQEGALGHADGILPPLGGARRDGHHEIGNRNVGFGQDLRADVRVAHGGDALVVRQMGNGAVGGACHERVDRAFEAVDSADGAWGDLGLQARAGCVFAIERFEHVVEEAFGPGFILFEGEAERAAAAAGEFDDGGEIAGVFLIEIVEDLDDAEVGAAHRFAQRVELACSDPAGIGGVAVGVAVADRVCRGKAQRSGLERAHEEALHGRDVVSGCGFAADGALAHHIEADRVVGGEEADVHRPRLVGDGVDIVGEAFPPPVDAFVQRGAGDVFHALHQRDQRVPVCRAARRETDAAVAHDGGGHAMAGRGLHVLVPADLAVVVGVDVEEAGGDERTVCIDGPAGRSGDAADFGDAATGDGDVGREGRGACAIDDGSAANDEVVHLWNLPGWRHAVSA
jgi:hypothetical protein